MVRIKILDRYNPPRRKEVAGGGGCAELSRARRYNLVIRTGKEAPFTVQCALKIPSDCVNERTPFRSDIVPFPLECRPGISQNHHQDAPAITGIHSSIVLPVIIAMPDPTQLLG
jgi:hypothetical protein